MANSDFNLGLKMRLKINGIWPENLILRLRGYLFCVRIRPFKKHMDPDPADPKTRPS
jgi:hypothetical protein